MGIWTHPIKKISFCLCVDDFGLKYCNQQDDKEFIDHLGTTYKYTVDWLGRLFCCLTFDWNYNKGHMDISMPNYDIYALNILQYNKQQSQYSPHIYNPIIYGKVGQRPYTTSPDTSQLITSQETIPVQSVLGTFLYYARSIDGAMLTDINDIGTQQAEPTKNTQVKIERLLNYAATYPHVKLRFHTNGIILQVDSDAAYLVFPKARSRIVEYFRLDNKFKNTRTTSQWCSSHRMQDTDKSSITISYGENSKVKNICAR